MTSSPVAAAVTGALAAEYQASWGYQLLGPRLGGAPQAAAARAAGQAHSHLIDVVVEMLAAIGLTAESPRTSYPLAAPVTDNASAVAYAAMLEHDCAAAWRYVVAQTVANLVPTATGSGTRTGSAAGADPGVRTAPAAGAGTTAPTGSATSASPTVAATSTGSPTVAATGLDPTRTKTLAVDALIASAVRAADWRVLTNPSAATTAFPGT